MTTMKLMLIPAALILLGGTASTASGQARKSAAAGITDAKGAKVGDAKFKEVKGGVELTVKVTGLPAGEHGLHVHEAGKCEAPDFKSAGGHFNPEKKQHGMQNPAGHHVGDMPNLNVDAKGKGTFKTTISGATLAGDGANSLFHAGGTSVVIHEKADDMKSDPAGNAGARIACGVVR
jgi:superoxide dismutase, Cu-Zn family